MIAIKPEQQVIRIIERAFSEVDRIQIKPAELENAKTILLNSLKLWEGNTVDSKKMQNAQEQLANYLKAAVYTKSNWQLLWVGNWNGCFSRGIDFEKFSANSIQNILDSNLDTQIPSKLSSYTVKIV